MAVGKIGNGDGEFARAAFDERRDSEQVNGVRWETCVGTTSQKGVWAFRTVVHNTTERRGARPIVALEESWPNARTTSFAAFWYQHQHKVARQVEAWADHEAIAAIQGR